MLKEKKILAHLPLGFVSAVLCLFCIISKAQDSDTSKPILNHITNPAPVKKRLSLKPAGDFDQRFSFIENEGVSIWGYRIGLSVNDVYKVGIGGYFLQQELAGIKLDQGVPINQLTKSVYYGTVYYEPFLFRRKRWEMSLVFELGYGKAVLDSTNKIRGRFLSKTEKQDFVPAGMGYSVNFIIPDIKGLHFLTYLGLNGMLGLRKAIFESDLKYNFDGWYWSIGSAVFIDKIFADFAGKKKKTKQLN